MRLSGRWSKHTDCRIHIGLADVRGRENRTVPFLFFLLFVARFRYPFKTLIEKPMLWKAGKFYTVEQDEDGYLYIVRYAVEFKF